MEPKDVSDVDLAFPAKVIELGLLPKWDNIPEEFKDPNNEWNLLASKIFCLGSKPLRFKEGVDRLKAMRHLLACLKSFQPQHEHKTAGVGWLLSHWMDEAKHEPPEEEDVDG